MDAINPSSVFIGNAQASENIMNWLQHEIPCGTHKLSKECVCVVVGNSGVGKTYGTLDAIKRCNSNLEMFYLNKDQCTNSKDFRDYIAKLTSSNVILQFSNLPSRKTLLFIDDIESLLDADRTFVNSFNAILTSTHNAIKIIVSCNTTAFKALSKSLVFGHCVLMNIPSVQDIVEFINNTLHNTVSYELRKQVAPIRVKEIAIDCLGNLSTALNMIRMEVLTRCSLEKTMSIHDTSNSSHQDKLDNFPEVAKMFQTTDRHDIRFLVELDPWLHPLRFHENVLHELGTRVILKKDKELVYTNILMNLCIWDHMMTVGKGGDISYAIEHACGTILLMRDHPKKKTYQSCASVDEFTRMFNYLSLKKKNQLAVYDAEKVSFPWSAVGSMHKKMYDVSVKNYIKVNNCTSKNAAGRSKKTFFAKDK